MKKSRRAACEGAEMEIDLEKLRAAINVLIENTVRNVGPVVTVDVDEFWTVPNDDAFELGGDPQLTIGSVSESWAQAQKVTSDRDATVGYGYVWIADVLRALGYEYVG